LFWERNLAARSLEDTVYGTVARLRVKDGMQAAFEQNLKDFESRQTPGFVRVLLYRTDADHNEFIMTVAFIDKAAYVANAESPEQAADYEGMRALLESDPEWNDGEIVLEFAR
jgi:quinol monooxygenase YgiN